MSGWRVGPGLIPGFAVSRDTPGGGGQEKEGPEKTTLQRTPSPNPRGGGGGLQIPCLAPFSPSRVASLSRPWLGKCWVLPNSALGNYGN